MQICNLYWNYYSTKSNYQVIAQYHHIIAGGGLAGLSLAYRLRKDPHFNEQSILILDSSAKQDNDRTWCFWSKEAGLFDKLIYHSWSKLSYLSTGLDRQQKVAPYKYNMIRGIDFYDHCRSFLEKQPNTDIVQARISDYEGGAGAVTVMTEVGTFSGAQAYKSYPDKFDFEQSLFVWQHFKGWIIESEEDAFDPDQATLMDFRVDQDGETRFFYVLPLSERKAMVEYTIFSDTIYEPSEYDPHLQDYLKNYLGIKNYTTLEEEVGAIPMTTYDFQAASTQPGIIPIGTNGGSVKASSGYAFTRVQRDMARLVGQLKSGAELSRPKSRYDFYDRVMMNAILKEKCSGKEVFDGLFKNLPFQSIFKFLDEEGSLFNDLTIFTGPPTLPFLKAFFEEI